MVDAIVPRKELRSRLGALLWPDGLIELPRTAASRGASRSSSRAARPRWCSASSACATRWRSWATPSCRCPAVHVAGTNGKGQHLRLRCEAMLRAAGLPRRALHLAAPGPVQRAHRGRRRGDRRRRRSAAGVARGAARAPGRRSPPTYFELGTLLAFWTLRARSGWTSRCSRPGSAAGSTRPPPRRPRADGAHRASGSTTWSSSARRWPPSPAEKAGIFRQGVPAVASAPGPGGAGGGRGGAAAARAPAAPRGAGLLARRARPLRGPGLGCSRVWRSGCTARTSTTTPPWR